MGCSPWCRKESDTTEHTLTFAPWVQGCPFDNTCCRFPAIRGHCHSVLLLIFKACSVWKKRSKPSFPSTPPPLPPPNSKETEDCRTKGLNATACLPFLHLCYTEGSPWTSIISITWVLVRNSKFQAPPWPFKRESPFDVTVIWTKFKKLMYIMQSICENHVLVPFLPFQHSA